ncbi:hypothetical protein [Pseudohongiella spirulinae]|uniref:Uncharacterized protein n=1 Tax=Pseudohongiella spirulinae TaxID=1249552 RepID=A0A0S2KH25_9GAMM|nr:hypothetical protein [Pseudohongiella spirulinae]ALO47628.1 hypothetical protein PS2015_3003 [Pseudohongiella spirulinae]
MREANVIVDHDLLEKRLQDAIQILQDTPDFAKAGKLNRVFDVIRKVLMLDDGCQRLQTQAMALEKAGLFVGTDWESPQTLVPALTVHSLGSPEINTVLIEAVSLMRLLAIAQDQAHHPSVSPEQAQHFLTQALAANLTRLFNPPSEAEREVQGRHAEIPGRLLKHIADNIGYEGIIDELITEIWRILQQRPIQVSGVKRMVTQIAVCQHNPDIELGGSGQGADRLVSSLFGPTQASREDPGIAEYQQRLTHMDSQSLQNEATGCARAMHDTGLVSAYHVILVRHLAEHAEHLLSDVLGLSATGRDCLLCYRELVLTLIDRAVHVATSQAIYGLALMLERGILYQHPMAPALWRQLSLELSETSRTTLLTVFGDEVQPETRLLEGVLCMLGLPLGIGQGNNPTCQSARALSMWAYNDPDYLLQMVTWAARDDEIIMHFEGQPVSSVESDGGVAQAFSLDLDPVSVLVVPHLDRIYAEMGRRCVGRDGDPHRWVNPEFHGWWTGRGFQLNVDVPTGKLSNLQEFIRYFYAAYHPFYNGNQPLIHPQPAGVAVTDSAARFIGWHAITILRVTLDPNKEMRVYFYNPNNDSGQNWGDGVLVSTSGNGERYGEASLPFEQFLSRLYIFHYDPLECKFLADVPGDTLNDIIGYIRRSWGADR